MSAPVRLSPALTGFLGEVVRGLIIALAIMIATFYLIRMIPGDIVDVIGIEGSLTYEQQTKLRADMGLTRSWNEQLVTWAGMVAHGNFGVSARYATSVVDLVAHALPATLALGLSAFAIGAALGVALPVLAILFPRSPFRWLVEAITIWSITVPTFSIGLVCVIVFAVWLHWIPAVGNLLVPALILGVDIAGQIAKMLYEEMNETLGADFIRTARAKGLNWRQIVIGHLLPNSFAVVLALLGLVFGGVLTGTITLEAVFGLPGIGTLTLSAIKGRDYPVVQAVIIWIGLSIVLANLLAEAAQRFSDPRARRA